MILDFSGMGHIRSEIAETVRLLLREAMLTPHSLEPFGLSADSVQAILDGGYWWPGDIQGIVGAALASGTSPRLKELIGTLYELTDRDCPSVWFVHGDSI